MTSRGFFRTLLFGVVGALALFFLQVVLRPHFGGDDVAAWGLFGAAVAYSGLLAGTPRRALRNGGAALAGGLVGLIVATSLSEFAIALALTLALIRSGLGGRVRLFRAVATELGLGVGGLCLASWLATPGPLGIAAGFWGYALVQSLYFLIPGALRVQDVVTDGDPFDRARQRLQTLLEQV